MRVASFQTAPVFGRSALTVETPRADSARQMLRTLDGADQQTPVMLVHGSDQAELSPEVQNFLRVAVKALLDGEHVTLVLGAVDKAMEISSQEAADLLNVSRPHVVKLAREGLLAHRKVGNRHRFSLAEVLTYRQVAAAARDQALAALSPARGYTAADF